MTNATATPTPIGAVATLYNVSCYAAKDIPLFARFTSIALNLPWLPKEEQKIPEQYLSGHHYFVDSTTPFFNLDTASHQYGMGALQKVNASDAPADALMGPAGVGNGAVQWLMLDVKPYVENKWKQVYRLDTAGGVPPKLCSEVAWVDGQTDSIRHLAVPYAAQYWIFV